MSQITEQENIAKSVQIYYMNKQTSMNSYSHIEEQTSQMLKSNGFEGFEHMGNLSFNDNKPLEYKAEELFALYNLDQNPLGTPEGQEFLREVGVGHTSMSIGDFFIFNGDTVFVVAGCGYTVFPLSEVKQ